MRMQYTVRVDDHPDGVLLTTYADFDLHRKAEVLSRELVHTKDTAVQQALLRDPRFVALLLEAGWKPPEAATKPCIWCGVQIPADCEPEQPTDYCHH